MTHRVMPILIVAVLTTFVTPASAAIISDGGLYTGITGSTKFGPGLEVENLFDATLVGTGDGIDVGDSYGTSTGVGNAVIAFQLDQVYDIDTLFYAQRQDKVQDREKNKSVSIWASATTPFSLADPGTTANVTDRGLNFTNGEDQFLEYGLGSTITGRYFRLEFVDAENSGNSDATGGAELRLGGGAVVAVPEPSSLAILFAVGVVACGRRRRRDTSSSRRP